MIALIVTLCTSAAMTDCTVYSLGNFKTTQQCRAVADIHRDVLGEGPKQNYRLECQTDDEAHDAE